MNSDLQRTPPTITGSEWVRLRELGDAVVLQAAATAALRGDVPSLINLFKAGQNRGLAGRIEGTLGMTVTLCTSAQQGDLPALEMQSGVLRPKVQGNFGSEAGDFTFQRAIALALARPHDASGRGAAQVTAEADELPTRRIGHAKHKPLLDAEEQELLDLAIGLWYPYRIPNRSWAPLKLFFFECCAWIDSEMVIAPFHGDALRDRGRITDAKTLLACEFKRPRRWAADDADARVSPLQVAVEFGNVNTASALGRHCATARSSELRQMLDAAIGNAAIDAGLNFPTMLAGTLIRETAGDSSADVGLNGHAVCNFLDVLDGIGQEGPSSVVRVRVLEAYLSEVSELSGVDRSVNWNTQVIDRLLHGAGDLGGRDLTTAFGEVVEASRGGQPEFQGPIQRALRIALKSHCGPAVACMADLLRHQLIEGGAMGHPTDALVDAMSPSSDATLNVSRFQQVLEVLRCCGYRFDTAVPKPLDSGIKRGSTNSSCLHLLAQTGNPGIVPLMIEAVRFGADPKARDARNRTVEGTLDAGLRESWSTALRSELARQAAQAAIDEMALDLPKPSADKRGPAA